MDKFWLWIATQIKNAALRKSKKYALPPSGARDLLPQRKDWAEVLAHQGQIERMEECMVPIVIRVHNSMVSSMEEKSLKPALVCASALNLKLRSMADVLITEASDD